MSATEFLKLLDSGRPLIGDGAMGTMLHSPGHQFRSML